MSDEERLVAEIVHFVNDVGTLQRQPHTTIDRRETTRKPMKFGEIC